MCSVVLNLSITFVDVCENSIIKIQSPQPHVAARDVYDRTTIKLSIINARQHCFSTKRVTATYVFCDRDVML